MRRRTTLIVLAISAATLLLLSFGVNAVSNSVPYHTPTVQAIAKVPAADPSRLSIPSINVDAPVVFGGLNADGTMDVEKDPDQTTWYKLGVRPGDEGSAVIAGHYGWIGLHGAVFNSLHLLQKGDKVSVLDVNGKTLTFSVTKTEKYDPSADATAIFQSYDGKAHLNIITCNGVWVSDKDSYSDRLVVFTDLD